MQDSQPDKNSVLILSTESDSSTSAIIDWLKYYKVNYVRINYPEDNLKFISSDIDNTYISVNKEIINVRHFTAFWYRKGLLKMNNYHKNYSGAVNKRLEYHLENEKDDLINFLHKEFSFNKKAFTTSENVSVNKLNVLKLAKNNGLDIPFTQVVTSKKMIANILEKFPLIITKPISGSHLTVPLNGKRYMTFTTEISKSNFREVPDNFLPSLVQECIPKKYEIRAFYFCGAFYSMAIFSQQTDQTSTDFRKYSTEHPNRTIPFKLPTEIDERLKTLMSILGLNTGSVDLIYTSDNRFVFLEVNPVGQFGMVSYPCNYHIEKTIANYFNSEAT